MLRDARNYINKGKTFYAPLRDGRKLGVSPGVDSRIMTFLELVDSKKHFTLENSKNRMSDEEVLRQITTQLNMMLND